MTSNFFARKGNPKLSTQVGHTNSIDIGFIFASKKKLKAVPTIAVAHKDKMNRVVLNSKKQFLTLSKSVQGALDHSTSEGYKNVENLEDATKVAKQRIANNEFNAQKGIEIESLHHQEDIIEGINPAIRQELDEAGFDQYAYIGGVADSDLGKLEAYRELLIETNPASDKSNLLFNVIRGKGPAKTRRVMRTMLDAMGFENKNLLNENLSNEQLRKVFRENPILQKFLHELPGMSDAFMLLEINAINESQFIKRMQTNLFHNGPNEGFWGRLTNVFVPFSLKSSADIHVKDFFRNTVYEGKTEDGLTLPSYPTTQSFEGSIHTLLDRISGNSRGGFNKIYLELQEIPGNRLVQMQEILHNAPKGAIEQLNKLKISSHHNQSFTAKQKAILDTLISSGEERLQLILANNKWAIRFIKNDAGDVVEAAVNYINHYGQKVVDRFVNNGNDIRFITQINDFIPIFEKYDNPGMNSVGNGFADELNYSVQKALKQEEAMMGDAVRGLSCKRDRPN